MVAVLAAAQAQSLDFSLSTSGLYTKLADVSGQLDQSAGLTFSSPLGKGWSFRSGLTLTVGGSYDGASGTTTPTLPWTLSGIDIPELNLSYSAPREKEGLDRLAFAIGRFYYVDPTGSLFAYRLDGFNFQAVYPILSLRVVLGYTGLLPSTAPLISTTADSTYGDPDFAPPRAVATFGLRSPRIRNHDAFFAFTVQEDLRNPNQLIQEYQTVQNLSSSGPASSAYLSAGFTGNPTSMLSYSAFGIFEFGRSLSYVTSATSTTGYIYEYAAVRAWSFGAQAQLALGPGMSGGLRALYGSGDPDAQTATSGNTSGNATEFVPITVPVGLVLSPDPANLTQIEADFYFQPFPSELIGLRAVQASSKTLLYVKNGTGPVSLSGVLPTAGLGLLGVEEDLGGTVRLLSDVNLTTSFGFYVPFAGSYDSSYIQKSPFGYAVSAGLSIAL